MQRLADEGMKFTNAYATPVCTPTRVSLLTGMNVAHHRVTLWTSPVRDNPTDSKDDQFELVDWNYNGLSNISGVPHTVHATPFPKLLKEAGYFTIHVGKAHWGSNGTPGSNPYNLGFMVNIAGTGAGHPQSYLGHENYGNTPGKAGWQAVPDLQQYYGTDTFLTEALTIEALKTLEEPIKKKLPFFLNLSHYAVHVPINADRRFFQKYLDAGLDSLEAGYATLIEGMDKSLGDVMDFLKRKKIENNTVIIFMSDNGGLSNPKVRSGTPFTQNAPLRAGKGSVFEGGVREPMIVKWPGNTKNGTIANQPVIVEDFFPTILEIAGLKKYKTLQSVDGRSFVSVLKNNATKLREKVLLWHSPNKWIPKDGPGINYYSAIRKGDWKLIYSYRTGKAELYDLKNDIGEINDLSEKNPQQIKIMLNLLTVELKKNKAQLPVSKATGEVVAYPK
jgi:arylsulfatase A-like enzyme